MAGKGDKAGSNRGVVIKRNEIVEGGHHGGAWKVAYADFVTAMMAFFLLMWLLNATTEDQRKGLADYFSPNNLLSHASSGVGQPFGGRTAFAEGAMASDMGAVRVTMGKRPVVPETEDGEVEVTRETRVPPAQRTAIDPLEPAHSGHAALHAGDNPSASMVAMDRQAGAPEEGRREPGRTVATARSRDDAAQQETALSAGPRRTDISTGGPRAGELGGTGPRPPTDAELRAELERQEKASFEQAAEQIREAVRDDPALADLARQLAIDMTPDGLRIQIMDEVKQPMFATGSSVPNERARLLLQKVAPVLRKLPQSVSIAGYTDAAPFPGPGRTNWELSTERANATRRLLVDGGLAADRVRTVTGHADRDPLLPADPFAAANRRIAIVVLREASGVGASAPAPAARR